MNLYEIWKRIGKQPLRITRRKEAIVFVNGEKYKISKIVYDSGKFVGFEAEKYQWFSEMNKPEEDVWVVVRDDNGKEHYNHQWVGHAWYAYVRNNDGSCDGWRSDVDIVSWRYQ